MKKKDRIILIESCPHRWGKYEAGQTGIIIATYEDVTLIDFDGFEYERARAEEFKKAHGEDPLSETVFLNEVPTRIVRLCDAT